MAKFLIEISDFASEWLTPEDIRRLIEAEAKRLWHIARSTPKPHKPMQSPLGNKLLDMFLKREKLGGLTETQKASKEKVLKAIEMNDLDSLNQMYLDQIWTKK